VSITSPDEKYFPLFEELARDHPTDGDARHPMSLRQVEDILFERDCLMEPARWSLETQSH
jgi:hypothetical protein